ncbi:MAG: hypothetical protein AAGF23_02240 [Acidobacteriota bacterium]
MINRAAVILRAKGPMIEWINTTDHDDLPPFSESDVNGDRNVYLIAESAAATEVGFREWLELNYQTLFEAELTSWITEPRLWPHPRTFALFSRWFDVEWHSMVFDTTGDDFLEY